MSTKTYSVSQRVNLNGKKESRSFQFCGTNADVTAFISDLEGKVTVKEVIIEQGSDETLVSVANFVSNIIMRSPTKGASGCVIQSYARRSMIFKNTVSADDIRLKLATVKPFVLVPTDTPSSIAVNSIERTAVATV